MLLSAGFQEYFQASDTMDFKKLSKEEETPVRNGSVTEELSPKRQTKDTSIIKKREIWLDFDINFTFPTLLVFFD